jgi:hypothetical protein
VSRGRRLLGRRAFEKSVDPLHDEPALSPCIIVKPPIKRCVHRSAKFVILDADG